jgi:hypothetical protein
MVGANQEVNMGNKAQVVPTASTLGDTAVDGLLAGASAGIVMGIFLIITGLITGGSWRQTLAAFDPAVQSPLSGALTHLAVAGVYGLVFAILRRSTARTAVVLPTWALGLGYGLALWLLAAMTLNVQAAGVDAGGWLQEFAGLQFAAAHLVYGLTLGWLLGRGTGQHDPVKSVMKV